MGDSSPLEFVLDETETPEAVTLVLRGDLDVVASETVVGVLRRHLETGRRIIMDLTEVVFMDSSGLAAIVKTPSTPEWRARMTLVPSRHGQPDRLLRMSGVLDLFPSAEPG